MYKKALENLEKIVLNEQTRLDLSAELYAFVTAESRPMRSLLISGPPGTGKTMIVKALMDAADFSLMYFGTYTSEFGDGYFDNLERVRAPWMQARSHRYSVFALEEFGGWTYELPDMYGVKQLISAWDDSLDIPILFVTTIYSDQLQKVPIDFINRFDAHLRLPLPSEEERRKIFNYYIDDMPLQFEVPEFVIYGTHGYTGRDIKVMLSGVVSQQFKDGTEFQEDTFTIPPGDWQKWLDRRR